MKPTSFLTAAAILPALLGAACLQGADAAPAPAQAQPPAAVVSSDLAHCRAGAQVALWDKTLTVRQIDMLPCIDNSYTRLFRWDAFENPKLAQLRRQEKLDDVVTGATDEFDRMVRLLDWAHHRFKRIGRPDYMEKDHVTPQTIKKEPRGALEIVANIDQGGTYGCIECGQLLVSTLNSFGYVARLLCLKKAVGFGKNEGAQEHTVAEVWSNQYRKWVMVDAKYALYIENQKGVPLNAWELRGDWFYRLGQGLVCVFDKDRTKRTKADFPVFRADYKTAYGSDSYTLAFGADNEMYKYAHIGYIPNNNCMDEGPDYDHMFISQDEICHHTNWLPSRRRAGSPGVDPYFPINQAALSLAPGESGKLHVAISTLTPNFKTFQVRLDGTEWKDAGSTLAWELHDGANKLEARSVNKWDVPGPVSTVELELK